MFTDELTFDLNEMKFSQNYSLIFLIFFNFFRLPFLYVFACQIFKAERDSQRDIRTEVGRICVQRHSLYKARSIKCQTHTLTLLK